MISSGIRKILPFVPIIVHYYYHYYYFYYYFPIHDHSKYIYYVLHAPFICLSVGGGEVAIFLGCGSEGGGRGGAWSYPHPRVVECSPAAPFAPLPALFCSRVISLGEILVSKGRWLMLFT